MIFFFGGDKHEEKNKEDIYYCFKFRCKRCPRYSKCEKEARKDNLNGNNVRTNNRLHK